jgi:TolB-like protein/DNA-binding winged helix-turn-helix (wHTH) protein
MAHPAPSIGHYQFGVFTVDSRACELRKQGLRIKLQERPLQILLMLLERPGETVTREELRARIWPEGTFVDFDHSISSAVNKLRTALHDSARTPRYIETVGRAGYRFIYPVAPHLTPFNVLPPEQRPVLVPRPVAPTPPRRTLRWTAITLVALFVAAIAGSALVMFRQTGERPIRSIAVLPMKNLSSDPEQEYFSEGFTDELITRLASLQGLRVISRTSVMQYKDSTKPLPQIARELGVDAIVEGSVLHAGDRVRITTQLIRAADDRHLWAQSYDRDERDILALQNDVARQVADNIQLTLAAADRQKLATARPIDHEAHELYLRGLYHWEKRSAEELRAAIGYFQQAIDRQPDYAAAYAGMANCYALLGGYTGTPQAGFVDQARTAAVKALEIDPQLARAHVALAVLAQNYDWDWKTAEKEYQKAIDLDPNDATAHHWYGEFLGFQGRFDEASAQYARAEQLDPLSSIIQTDHADLFYYARQYDRAEQTLLVVLARDPEFGRAHGLLRGVYQAEGKYKESLADVNAFHGEGDATWHFASLCRSYSGMGDKRHAQEALAQLEALGRKRDFDAGAFVYAYASIGNKERAFAWLDRAYQQHSNIIAGLRVNPVYDGLRDDPRFHTLLKRVGLEP